MKKSNGNYIKVTIYKAKICPDCNISSYSLKLDFLKQSFETEKISTKDVDFGGKSYFFDLSTSQNQNCLEITAISRTLLIFDSYIAKVSIPVNINKLDDKRQWYYLKNSKDENVISILTSTYCEIKSDKSVQSQQMDNSLQNSSCIIVSKNDMSYDNYRNNSNNSNHNFRNALNKTTANANLSYNNNYNNLNFLNNYSVDEIGLENKKYRKNLENTVIYNENYNQNYKSPDMSLISNNIFSPNSYRVDGEKIRGTGFSYTGQMLANLNSRLNINNTMNMTMNNTLSNDLTNQIQSNNNLNLNLNDSFLDVNLIDGNYLNDHPEIILKIKNKILLIKDEQEKLRKLNEDVYRNKEKIRQNEKILFREKEKLEGHIKLFKSSKSDFENKQNNMINNFQKFNNELLKFKREKEIFNFEKNMFLNLNLLLDAPKFNENCYDIKNFNENNNILHCNNNFVNSINEINEINDSSVIVNHDKNFNNSQFKDKINSGLKNNHIKISGINSQSHPGSHIHTPSSNGKKGINSDKSQNLNLQKSKIREIRERQVSRDKSNQNSFDINNYSEKNSLHGLGMNLNYLNTPFSVNGVNNLNIHDNYNTISNNNDLSSTLIHKTLNNSANLNVNKFYTPIAQIDLNNKRNSNGGTPISNISNFELSSPTKVCEKEKEYKEYKENKDNKLIDSLDNLNLLLQSNRTLSDKKNNSKFKKAVSGIEDQRSDLKTISKKGDKINVDKSSEKRNPVHIQLQLPFSKNGLDKNNLSSSKEIGRESKEYKEKKIINSSSGLKNSSDKSILSFVKKDITNNSLSHHSNYGSSNNLTNFSTTKYSSNSVIKLSSGKKSKIN